MERVRKNLFKICNAMIGIALFCNAQNDSYNLLSMIQEGLVLETKQITLPEFPYAFNPSIIRWDNKLLLSFRVIPDPKQPYSSWMGLVHLNENFEPIGKIQQLPLRKADSKIPTRAEDGRLITVGNRLMMVYSDNSEDVVITKGGCRMYVTELKFDGEKYIPLFIECFSSYEDNNKDKRERNWVPFDYYGKLLLAYSICPHKIYYSLLGTERCETLALTKSFISWQWGDLRGGTPALMDGDSYIAFFHSCKRMKTPQSYGKEKLHYFMGAYRFEREFPFAVTHVSSHPIVGPDFYHAPDYKPYWGNVKVVFPGGFLIDDNFFWVVYGKDDHEMWVAQLDKKKLYESLVPVTHLRRK